MAAERQRALGNGGNLEQFAVVRSLPHGHVAAVLGTLRKIGLDKQICSTQCREARIILAMLARRILSPGSIPHDAPDAERRRKEAAAWRRHNG